MSRTRTTAFDPVVAYLKSQDLTFDNYKGTPGNFRPWDNQLRQPILPQGLSNFPSAGRADSSIC